MKLVCEDIRKYLVSKSKEEIKKGLETLSPKDLFQAGIEYDNLEYMEQAIDKGVIIDLDDFYTLIEYPKYDKIVEKFINKLIQEHPIRSLLYCFVLNKDTDFLKNILDKIDSFEKNYKIIIQIDPLHL